MIARTLLLAATILSIGPSAFAQAPAATGLDAWRALVGNTIIGETAEGEALAEYFAPDGTAKNRIADEADEGVWTLRGDRVCTDYSGDDDGEEDGDSDDENSGEDEQAECYGLSVQGDVAILTDESGSARTFRILPGNPEKL